MLDTIEIQCPTCHETFTLGTDLVEDTLKHRKRLKVAEVARQLTNKRGPFYDRWKAAMEARGEQKRCKNCLAFDPDDVGQVPYECAYTVRCVNPGQFACRLFIEYDWP